MWLTIEQNLKKWPISRRSIRYCILCMSRFTLLLGCGAILLSGGAQSAQYAVKSTTSQAIKPTINIVEQRTLYQRALREVKQGKITAFKKTKDKLIDYPLYPYLEYQQLKRRLYRLPVKDVKQFLDTYDDTVVAKQLQKRWLHTLANHNKWQQYIEAFDPGIENDKLKCHYLRALYLTGEKNKALAGVPSLWLVDKSQAKSCDSIFAVWVQAGHLEDDLVWQRLTMALYAREYTLARYLVRFFSKANQVTANSYISVYRKPILLKQTRHYKAKKPYQKQLILDGLGRLSRRNLDLTIDLWDKYQTLQNFNAEEKSSINRKIALALAKKYHSKAQAWLLASYQRATDDQEIIEWGIRTALREQDWNLTLLWIGRLTLERQNTKRWSYWKARALQQQEKNPPPPLLVPPLLAQLDNKLAQLDNKLAQLDQKYAFSPPLTESAIYPKSVKQIFTQLAWERNFYSFLAADILQQDYQLLDKSLPPKNQVMAKIQQHAGIQRALELYILGLNTEANREWNHSVRDFSNDELMAAAYLAKTWGWYSKSIQSAVVAKQWDNLSIRFPFAHMDDILFDAKLANIDSSWLTAVARQESAFVPDARSPANALGLLQLLDSTASATANRLGLKYKGKSDLLLPELNIRLGSSYLGRLLTPFDSNRILATAAYNAGPYRVRQWHKSSDSRLPFDIWIETIPFDETRNYVENVLTFTVIYEYRYGRQSKLIRSEEQNQLL